MDNLLIEKVIDSPILEVWKAISDSVSISKWFMKNNFRAELGAHFQFKAEANKNWDGVISCVVTKIDPPAFLSYSWTGSHIGYPTHVQWKLSSIGDKTKLELKHIGLKSSTDPSAINWFDSHLKGWTSFVNQLATTLKKKL